MNKGELVDQLAARADLSKAEAGRVVDALFDVEKGIISSVLRNGQKVQITGFGNFEARKRAARTGRNPRTGETIQIAATVNPAFKAGKGLKDALNG